MDGRIPGAPLADCGRLPPRRGTVCLTLALMSTEEWRTLPLGLAFFQGRYARDIPLTSGGATILIYLVSQRQFIRGITAGLVKG